MENNNNNNNNNKDNIGNIGNIITEKVKDEVTNAALKKGSTFLDKFKRSIYDIKNSNDIITETDNGHKKYMTIILIVLSLILSALLYNFGNKNSEVELIANEKIFEKLQNTESGFSYDNDKRTEHVIEKNKTAVIFDTRQIELSKIIEENENVLNDPNTKYDKITLLTKENVIILVKDTKPITYNFDSKESREALMQVIKLSKNGFLIFLIITLVSFIQIYIIYIVIFKTIGKLTVSIFSGLTKYDITKEEANKIATYSATVPTILFVVFNILKKFINIDMTILLVLLIVIYCIYVIQMMTGLKQKGNVKKHE